MTAHSNAKQWRRPIKGRARVGFSGGATARVRRVSVSSMPVRRVWIRNAIIDFLDEEDVKHVYIFNDPKSGELAAHQNAPAT